MDRLHIPQGWSYIGAGLNDSWLVDLSPVSHILSRLAITDPTGSAQTKEVSPGRQRTGT